jgi:hypothetical protein
MPIRLNLLAEAQAAEEMRRRDPVKRAIWVGVILVSITLAWSSSLQLKAMLAKNQVTHIEGEMSSLSNSYRVVLDDKKKVEDIRHKLTALTELATNRFLHASVLNALQQTTVEDVQLLHYRSDQSYVFTEEVKARTNDNSRVVPGKAATVTEKVLVTFDGSDSSQNPGDQVPKFKEVLGSHSYFRELLGKTNVVTLKSQSSPEVMQVPGSTVGKACVQFTLECRLPEKTR